MASDAETEKTLFDDFQDWKSGLADNGLSFAVDYSSVWLSADQSPAEDEAASGMFRFYGSWDLVGGESGNTGSLVWKVENRPFIRAGHANDGGTLLETSVSVGFGYQPVRGKNLLGVGLNYGEPNSDTFGPDLPEQTTIEVFYRFQFAREFAITPSLQYMKDPALNTDPDQDSICVLGLRARLAL